MVEVSHFLKPGGWKITRADGVSTKMLAKNGTILIGRNETGNECFLVWMDGSKCLQIVRLQRQDKSSDWRGTFTHGGQDYWIKVKGKGKSIAAEIGPLDKKASLKPPTEYSTTGTWGAEAASGGGGGGKGVPMRPEKGKAAGSGEGDNVFEYCFPAKTRIAMADDSSQAISEICVGCRVQCWDHAWNSLAEGRVELVLEATADRLIQLNGSLAASPAHRAFTSRGYLRFDEVQIGDWLFSSPSMKPERVTQVKTLFGPFPVFNLIVKPFSCFFAEGRLVEDYDGSDVPSERYLRECLRCSQMLTEQVSQIPCL